MIDILWLPFVACVVLLPLHCWLGLQVLDRGVIFVDLALAQLAALGLAVTVALGATSVSPIAALVAALGGGVFFALVRPRNEDVPQEAIIGITYGVASALTVLVLAPTPHGHEEINALLVGSILLVDPVALRETLALYLGITLGYLVLRRATPRLARRGQDLLFYAVFAVVITQSVRIAGVLVVFSFLIVPAVAARLCTAHRGTRFALGLGFGVAAASAGLVASYLWDLPTGSAIVVAFGALLVLAALTRCGARVLGVLPESERVATIAASGDSP